MLFSTLGKTPWFPPTVFQQVFDLHRKGLGVYRITTALEKQGMYTSPSSVDRLLRVQPPYYEAERTERRA